MTTKTIKTVLFASLLVAMILPFSGINFADAKQADDKSLVKEKIKDKMNKQADKDKQEKSDNKKFTSEEYGIPYNLFFEENGKLVVGIDAGKAIEFKKQYSEDDVKADLDSAMDLDVRYYGIDLQDSIRGGSYAKDNGVESTITVVKNNKIIVSGHTVALNNVVHAKAPSGTYCQEVKITKDNNYSGAYADAAYGIDTTVTGCGHSYINDSVNYNGQNYSVTYGVANDIVLNQQIYKSGINAHTSGYILDVDVTAKPDGIVLNDQVVGNYQSWPGDSGAPIITITGGAAKLIGQHVGKACEVDLNSGTNYGYWCNGSDGLTIFSPWDQVATHLGNP